MGMEPRDAARFELLKATQRLEQRQPSIKGKRVAKYKGDNFARYVSDPISGYHAIVQAKTRWHNRPDVSYVGKDLPDLIVQAMNDGLPRPVELRFMGGKHPKDIRLAEMYHDANKAIRSTRRSDAYDAAKRLGVEVTPEMRAMDVGALEEHVARLRVEDRVAKIPEAEKTLSPAATAELENNLEIATMNDAWGYGDEWGPPDIDPPEASLGPDEPKPLMPGGTGEAMELQPDESHPGDKEHTAEAQADLDPPQARASAAPDHWTMEVELDHLPDHEREAVQAQLSYAEQLRHMAATASDPEVAEAALIASRVVAANPTAPVAAARPPSAKKGGAKPSLEKRLVKRLKR